MSGVSLAADSRTEADRPTAAAAASKPNRQQPMMGGVMGSLRVIELQLIAFIMVFSASGLVPLLDLVFPAFTTTYLIALSRLCFPSTSASCDEIFRGGRLFQLYVLVGTTVGLFLPLAYVLGGFARGDDHAVRSATPHLFLLSFQILTENVISGLGLFSAPVRALVPLLYTVRRIFVVINWVSDVWLNKILPANAPLKDVAWFWFGRSLAVANLVYFSINLFCFLIPQFLPHAFEKYFRERDEVRGKMAEDKRPIIEHSAADAKQNSSFSVSCPETFEVFYLLVLGPSFFQRHHIWAPIYRTRVLLYCVHRFLPIHEESFNHRDVLKSHADVYAVWSLQGIQMPSSS